MNEQIIINIARPEVGIEYRAATKEAELPDRLAAAELALHALAQHVCELHTEMGVPCPGVVANLAASEIWRRGL